MNSSGALKVSRTFKSSQVLGKQLSQLTYSFLRRARRIKVGPMQASLVQVFLKLLLSASSLPNTSSARFHSPDCLYYLEFTGINPKSSFCPTSALGPTWMTSLLAPQTHQVQNQKRFSFFCISINFYVSNSKQLISPKSWLYHLH